MTSEQIDQLATALAGAQAKFPNPPRNREVTVQTNSGSSYKFKYATLDAVLDAIRAPMAEAGLAVVQTLAESEGGKFRLQTRLMHKSGQWISSDQPLFVERPGNQAFGSALTYARRYALTSMLGIAAEEDDDANGADGNKADTKERGKSAPKKDDRGAPADIVKWAAETRDKIDAVKSLTDLAPLDADVNKREMPDTTRAFLKARIDARKSIIVQTQV